MRKHLIALVTGCLMVLGCGSGPPVKTSSGESIDRVTIEERFATSDEVKETNLRSDRLRTAIELMEQHGVMSLSGSFASKTVHTASVTVIVKPAEGAERRIVVQSCAHENVCPFLEAALAKRLIEHRPMACRSEAPCAK